MSVITFYRGCEQIQRTFSGRPSLRSLLLEAGLPFPMPCGGNHTCGKCKVRCAGQLAPPCAEEAERLSPEERSQGIRLACYVQVLGDASVWLPEQEVDTLSAVVLPAHTLRKKGWGLAVDIGTTTVAAQLYRLEDGRIYGEALGANEQAGFGADVISRIEHSNQHGVAPLTECIHQQLERMAASCMAQAGVSALDCAVVTGNTTMLHFWEGLDPRGIAVAPFVPVSLFGGPGACTLGGVPPYLPPCLGAYVGADITCAVLASGLMDHPEETALLIDLGTNGEIVLAHGGTLYCASTAMGPAFEGAGLSCGMQAAPGAITAIRPDGRGGVTVEVLGSGAAEGLCGSGVLDAAAALLELGIMDETGLLDDEAPGITQREELSAWQIPGTQVFLTQKDIRQIQLAKAAVCAGICTLLEEAGLTPEAVDRLYIAGGFGHHMNRDSTARIGLFPPVLAPRARVLGNAALAGAAAVLLDEAFLDTLSAIRSRAREIPLSGNRLFSEYYMEHMLFASES